MSSASAAITAGYIHMHCLSAINIADLHSYALQNSGTHRCQIFVYPPHLPPLPLSYIHTHCLSAVNIADLHSYALQNLVGMHRCQTFVCAPRQPSLPLATFIPAAHLPSTSLTSIRTHCRTLVRIAVRHLYILRVCCHYRWLHSYALLVCCQHCRPLFVHIAEPRRYAPLSDICMCSVSAAITAGYIRTHCSFAVNIADLRSYALQNLIGTYRSQTFLYPPHLPLLLRATCVRAARLPSTSPNSVRTHC